MESVVYADEKFTNKEMELERQSQYNTLEAQINKVYEKYEKGKITKKERDQEIEEIKDDFSAARCDESVI